MDSNPIMTPAEIKQNAIDLIKQVAKSEIEVAEQVKNVFEAEKHKTYAAINRAMTSNVASKTHNYSFSATLENTFEMIGIPPNITREKARKVVGYEANKQCKLIGDFIKAQGHNLTDVSGDAFEPLYGESTINCYFTFGHSSSWKWY